jgi:hypothetical protein
MAFVRRVMRPTFLTTPASKLVIAQRGMSNACPAVSVVKGRGLSFFERAVGVAE